MQVRGDHRDEGEAHRDELKERRTRLTRDAEAEERVGGEGDRDRGEPEESPLLADVARDEVAVGEGEESVLLASLSEPDTEQSARPDGDERLLELIAHLRGCRTRIEERGEAQQRVLHLLDLVPEH